MQLEPGSVVRSTYFYFSMDFAREQIRQQFIRERNWEITERGQQGGLHTKRDARDTMLECKEGFGERRTHPLKGEEHLIVAIGPKEEEIH